MNRKNILVRYDKDMRLRMMYPRTHKEITRDVVRFVRNTPGMNFVGFTFANEPELDRVIDQQVDYFIPMNQPFAWRVYDHDLLPSLGEKLIAREFVPENDPVDVMVFDLKETAPYLFEAERADIRRITSQDELQDIIYVLDNVCGGDNSWVHERFGPYLHVPGYLSIYASYVENQPASVAWTYFTHGHFAKLSVGCTIADYRKRGLYASLLATRLREVRERGYRFAGIETGRMSKPIVEKYGFRHMTTLYEYRWNGN